MPTNNRFTLKTYSSELYTWAPETSTKKNSLNTQVTKSFCTAIANSQGEDWVVTYIFDLGVAANGTLEHLAYVACDYVT